MDKNEDANKLMESVCAMVGISNESIELLQSSKTIKGNNKITIKTRNQLTKSAIFKSKSKLKESKIKVYEVLTKKRKDLLTSCQELCGGDGQIKAAFSINGRIKIWKNGDDKPIEVISHSSILKYK